MRARGMTFEQIGRVEGMTPSATAQDYTRGVKARIAAHGEAGDDKVLELLRLDGMERAVQTVMAANMPRQDADPPVLGDETVVLASVDRLLRISRRRGDILGWATERQAEPGDQPAVSRFDELADRRARRRANVAR